MSKMMLFEFNNLCNLRCSHINTSRLIILYVLLMKGLNTNGFCLIGNPSWTGSPTVSSLEYEHNASYPHERGKLNLSY